MLLLFVELALLVEFKGDEEPDDDERLDDETVGDSRPPPPAPFGDDGLDILAE